MPLDAAHRRLIAALEVVATAVVEYAAALDGGDAGAVKLAAASLEIAFERFAEAVEAVRGICPELP